MEYAHDEGCSISGGYVYRGERLPTLRGTYVYADFCSGRVWGLKHDGAVVTTHQILADTGLTIPSFGLDEAGELYILTFEGKVYRFVAQQEPTPIAMGSVQPPSVFSATPTATIEPAMSLPIAVVWGVPVFAGVVGMALLWFFLRRRI